MNLGPVYQSMFNRLSGFADLTSRLANGAGSVYTRVPQPDRPGDSSLFPYVVIESTNIQPWDTDDEDGVQALMSVHVYSRSQSVLEISNIGTAVYDALHKYQLVITGANTVDCLFDNSTQFEDPDTKTVHRVIDFLVTYDGI